MRIPRFAGLVQRAAREHVPLDVSLELTNRCNFRCAHCYIPDFHVPDGMRTPRILRLLEELAEMGTLFLALTGGEVLLRKDWAVIARRARKLGFQVMLLTNGALIGDAEAETMAGLDLRVEISFHSADPEVFDQVTGRKGSFRRVLAAVERLVRHGASVELTVPLTSLNPDAARSVPELAERLGVDYQVYTTLFARKDGHQGPLQLRLPGDQAVALQEEGRSTCLIPGEEATHVNPDEPLCAAGVRYAAISASGEVRACTVLPGVAGNLNEHSFREIWERSTWLHTLRNTTLRDLKTCSTCPKISYCGRCHAQALVEDGDMLGPSRTACDFAAAVEARHLKGA